MLRERDSHEYLEDGYSIISTVQAQAAPRYMSISLATIRKSNGEHK